MFGIGRWRGTVGLGRALDEPEKLRDQRRCFQVCGIRCCDRLRQVRALRRVD